MFVTIASQVLGIKWLNAVIGNGLSVIGLDTSIRWGEWWYADKQCKKKVTSIVKGSTGKKTLYAKWKKN